jgi:hypothetical protein
VAGACLLGKVVKSGEKKYKEQESKSGNEKQAEILGIEPKKPSGSSTSSLPKTCWFIQNTSNQVLGS